MKKNKKMSGGEKMAIAGGVAVASAVGAGAYYLLGPNKKAHQKKASILMAKMKKGVEQKVAKAKKLSKPLYHKAVDALANEYSRQYKVHEKDIQAIAKKLKSEWKGAAKKVVKKSAKLIKNKRK